MSLQQNLRSGYAALGSAAADIGCTDTGAAWIVKTFDPNHDAPVPNRGIPDECESKTIVREFKSAAVISASTFGLAPSASQTWNFHANILPLLTPWEVKNAILDPIYIEERAAYANNVKTGGIQTLHPVQLAGFMGDGTTNATGKCWPSGTYDPTFSVADVAGVKAYKGFDIPIITSLSQNIRLVAQAFELIDVTPVLNKAGSVTCYRVNSEFDQDRAYVPIIDQTILPPGTYVGTNFNKVVKHISLPLNDQDGMMNLPGTIQWEASRGAYVVAAMDPKEIGAWSVNRDATIGVGMNSVADVKINGIVTNCASLSGSLDFTNGGLNTVNPVVLSPTQTGGVLLQGLQPSATYQLNMKWIIESVPDVYDEDIVIANVSAQYDPQAIELYSKTVRVMPVGVPQDQNPLGEWFDNIMSILANTAAFVGGAISTGLTGDPGSGMMIGGGIGNAATWLGNYNKRARGDMLRM